MLLKDELAQINKFKLKEDRIRGICGKVVAKILLSKYTGIRKDEISIQKGKYGKPYFNNKEHIQFNISHSEEYVILAFTKEEKVGIDIEKIREFNDYKDIARQFFCDFESRDVINTNSINHFFKYWTQKEAFVKATGEGLWRDLTSFGIKNNTVYLVRCNGKKFLLHGWNVHSFNIRGEYMVSIALKRK